MSVLSKDIQEKAICLLEPGLSKHQALDRMIEAVVSTGHVQSREAFRAALYERVRRTRFSGLLQRYGFNVIYEGECKPQVDHVSRIRLRYRFRA